MFVSFQRRIDGPFVCKNDICVTLKEIIIRKKFPCHCAQSLHMNCGMCLHLMLTLLQNSNSHIYVRSDSEVYRIREGEMCLYEDTKLKHDCYVLELNIFLKRFS